LSRSHRARRLLGLLLLAYWTFGCASRLERDESWIEVRTEHIQLFSSAWPELALEMADRLELYHLVGRELLALDTLEERTPTYVYVLDDAVWYGELQASQHLRGLLVPHPHGNYAAVQGLSQREEALRMAQNLYTRILQQTRQSRVYPRWYETGISELLSTVEVREDHVLIGKVSRFRQGLLERGFRERNQRGVQRGAPLRGVWIPLRTVMTAQGEKTWPKDRRSMFYAESWALAFYLTRHRPAELARYLELFTAGRPHEEAFEEAFGTSHLILEQQLERHFKGRDRLWRIPREHFPVKAEARVQALDAASWQSRLGDLLISRRLPREAGVAERHFQLALEADPELASAHLGLASALAIQGKPGGDPHVERALELGPRGADMHLRAGEYFLATARSSAPVDRERLVRSRRELERAIELAPDLAAAHYALGQTHLLDGEDSRLAVEPLERAHALMGWQRDIALALGEAQLRSGNSARAREVLRGVIVGTHNDETRRRAEALLAEIDRAAPPAPARP
jgi:tetratricopeptide (TPR) repeat protein